MNFVTWNYLNYIDINASCFIFFSPFSFFILKINLLKIDFDESTIIHFLSISQLQCCGIEGPKDWDRNNYFNCSSSDIGSREACGVPFSCCKRKPNVISVLSISYKKYSITFPFFFVCVYNSIQFENWYFFENWFNCNINCLVNCLVILFFFFFFNIFRRLSKINNAATMLGNLATWVIFFQIIISM